MSAAAVATSAALAISGLEASGAGAATPAVNQLTSIPAVAGVKSLVSTPLEVKGHLFFGTAGVNGGELWSSDGTPTGTTVIKTFAGHSHAAPADLTEVNGDLFFEADNELWKSNGTAAGTVLVDANVDPAALADADGTLFIATPAGGLWKSHGTAAKTVEVKKDVVEPKTAMTPLGGRIYFTGGGPGEYGHAHALWTSDGTAAGTKRVVITPKDPQESYPGVYNPADSAVVKGTLYFTGEENSDGNGVFYDSIWKVSGAHAADVQEYGSDLTNVRGSLWFFDYNTLSECSPLEASEGGCSYSSGYDLWDGKKRVADLLPNASEGEPYGDDSTTAYGGQLTPVGKTLFFAAGETAKTAELWESDGTRAGTHVVDAVDPAQSTDADGTLYFAAKQPGPAPVAAQPSEIWTSDGTAAGTTAVTSFTAGAPTDLTPVGKTLFFFDPDATTGGLDLWELGP